jgi:hypothetical protein
VGSYVDTIIDTVRDSLRNGLVEFNIRNKMPNFDENRRFPNIAIRTGDVNLLETIRELYNITYAFNGFIVEGYTHVHEFIFKRRPFSEIRVDDNDSIRYNMYTILTGTESFIFKTMMDVIYGNNFIPLEYTDANVYSTLYFIRRFIRRCARFMPIMDYMFRRPVVPFRDIIEPIGTMSTISRICEDWKRSTETLENMWSEYVPGLKWVRGDSPDNLDILSDLDTRGLPHLWLLSYVRITNNMPNAPLTGMYQADSCIDSIRHGKP